MMKPGEIRQVVLCVHCRRTLPSGKLGTHVPDGNRFPCEKPFEGWFYEPALARVRVDTVTLGARRAKRWTVLDWVS